VCEINAHPFPKLKPCQDSTAVHTHLVDAEVGIGVKVVVFGRHVLGVGLLAAFRLATRNLGGVDGGHGSNLGSPQFKLPVSYSWNPQVIPGQPYRPRLPSFLPQKPPSLSKDSIFHFQNPPQSTVQGSTPIPQPRLPSLQSLCPRL
jgi:hypothetical protein